MSHSLITTQLHTLMQSTTLTFLFGQMSDKHKRSMKREATNSGKTLLLLLFITEET